MTVLCGTPSATNTALHIVCLALDKTAAHRAYIGDCVGDNAGDRLIGFFLCPNTTYSEVTRDGPTRVEAIQCDASSRNYLAQIIASKMSTRLLKQQTYSFRYKG